MLSRTKAPCARPRLSTSHASLTPDSRMDLCRCRGHSSSTRINSSSATFGINSRSGFRDTNRFPASTGYTVTCLSHPMLFSKVFAGAEMSSGWKVPATGLCLVCPLPSAFPVELMLMFDSLVLWLDLQQPLRHGCGLPSFHYIRRVDDESRWTAECSPPIHVCPLPHYFCHDASTPPLSACGLTPAMKGHRGLRRRKQ